MAKAGFIYFPVDNKDDTCTCIYCGIELAGWEPEDDPMYVQILFEALFSIIDTFVVKSTVGVKTKKNLVHFSQPQASSRNRHDVFGPNPSHLLLFPSPPLRT